MQLKITFTIAITTRAVQATRRPGRTDQTDRTRPVTTKSDTSGGRWWFLFSKTRLRRVEWWVSVSKTRATWSDRQMLKKCQNFLDPATFWCSLAPIRPPLVFLRSDPVVFAQIHSNPAKIYSPPSSDFLKSGDIWLDLPQISEDRLRSTKIDSDIWLNPAIFTKIGEEILRSTWIRRLQLRSAKKELLLRPPTRIIGLDRPDRLLPWARPIRPVVVDGRLRVYFCSTRSERVESGLGTNPIRPDPWTPLPLIRLMIWVSCGVWTIWWVTKQMMLGIEVAQSDYGGHMLLGSRGAVPP